MDVCPVFCTKAIKHLEKFHMCAPPSAFFVKNLFPTRRSWLLQTPPAMSLSLSKSRCDNLDMSSEWMTTVCLVSCSIAYWGLGRDFEVNHASTAKVLWTVYHCDIQSRELEVAVADRTLYEAFTRFVDRHCQKLIENHQWCYRITSTNITTTHLQCHYCARLCSARLELQTHLCVYRWTPQQHLFEGLPQG